MTRLRYVPHNDEKPEPRYGKGDPDARDEGDEGVEPAPVEWEFLSVANFLEYLTDEERDWYTTDELVGLSRGTSVATVALRILLEGHGKTLRARTPERSFRTFGDNPHTRWVDSGSHGGGGGDSIQGFVGRVG